MADRRTRNQALFGGSIDYSCICSKIVVATSSPPDGQTPHDEDTPTSIARASGQYPVKRKIDQVISETQNRKSNEVSWTTDKSGSGSDADDSLDEGDDVVDDEEYNELFLAVEKVGWQRMKAKNAMKTRKNSIGVVAFAYYARFSTCFC